MKLPRLIVTLLIGLELLLPALAAGRGAAANRWHTWTAANGLAGNIVQAIWEDPSGRMWFGTENGASRYDGLTLETYRGDGASLIDNNVWAISGDANAVWFATSNGVSELRAGRWRSYSSADGLPHNDVRTILAGRDGSVWVGTFGGGIGRRRPGAERWESVDISSAVGDPHVIVQASWQAGDGAVWFGTNGAGALRIDERGLERFAFKNEYQNIVWAIGSAAAEVWIGTFRGVVRIDRDGLAESVAGADAGISLADTEVLAVAVRDAGSIWLGTRAHGVLHRTAGGWERFSIADGLGRNYVQTILVDRLGRVWFGTRGGGVSLLDQRVAAATRIGAGVTARDVSAGSVIGLHGAVLEHNQNNLQFTFTATPPWLPAQDVAFRYWLEGPGGGVGEQLLRGGPAAQVRLSAPPLINMAPGAYALHVVPVIDGADGLESRHAFSIRSAPPAWGAAGLSVSADGAEVPAGATLGPSLWETERAVTLNFAAGDDNAPAGPLRYEYRLDGGDGAWQPAAGPRASLRLPAGQHRIEVQAIDSDGNRSTPATVAVVVPGPLWRMILAYLAIALTPGLLGAGAGAWGYRRWSRRLALRRAVRGHVIPYDVGPLISAPERYIGRQHVLDSVLGRIDHNSFYIYGEKRIGKTSLLAQIRRRLEQRNAVQRERLYVPVFRNIQDVPQEQFWQVLVRSISDAIPAPPTSGSPVRLAAAGLPNGGGAYDDFDAQDDLLALLAALEAGDRSRRPLLVLLLDEIDTFQRYDPLVRQRFRAFCQHMQEHMQVVLVGVLPPRAEAGDTSPWHNIFAPLALEPLDAAAALDLIRNYNHNPYSYEPAAEQALLSAGDRKPFDTQWLCAESVRAMLAAGRSRVLAADVEAGIAAVVAERRREYAAFWQQLGPAAQAELLRALRGGGALPPERVAQGGYDRLFEAGLAIDAGAGARLADLFQRWLRAQQC